MPIEQARHWILTIPLDDWSPPDRLSDHLLRIIGQGEEGENGYKHWQLVASFSRPTRLGAVKRIFGQSSHCEATRSEAAVAYCTKEDTRILGTEINIGELSLRRNSAHDWNKIRDYAIAGDLGAIPADIFIRYYKNLKSISEDNCKPHEIIRTGIVYWGKTGVGKSKRAYEEAGPDAYFKCSRTKWWQGYKGKQILYS